MGGRGRRGGVVGRVLGGRGHGREGGGGIKGVMFRCSPLASVLVPPPLPPLPPPSPVSWSPLPPPLSLNILPQDE